MKKNIIAGVFVVLGFMALSAFTITNNTNSESGSAYCKHGQCVKIKANGYRCQGCAQQGSSYCWSHNN